MTFGAYKILLGYYWEILRRWAKNSIWGVFWAGLIIAGIIIAVAALIGCVGGIVVGLPALVIYLAFNWVVPAFGGPAISYKVAIGLVFLLSIVYYLLHGKK